jgi:hypothetical protein
LKVGLCKELENHIFDYGVSNAANLMRTTQEKIAQYVGIKYGEDIANEISNKTTVKVAPPVYSAAIMLRHQEWEAHVRKKQKNTKTALDAKLKQLKAAASADRDVVGIANVCTRDLPFCEYSLVFIDSVDEVEVFVEWVIVMQAAAMHLEQHVGFTMFTLMNNELLVIAVVRNLV